jgi:hypothetical protein
LLWSVSDDNKLPKNPAWRFLVSGGTPMNLDYCLKSGSFSHDAGCTTQNVTIDNPGFPDSAACGLLDSEVGINGHVNWFDATYEGTLTWDENSIDHDYNFYMESLSPIGRLHVEFNSDETIDNFQTPFWKTFHDGSGSRPKGTVIGFTVVAGLVGFDCEHDCRVEVHPVHAIAMRVKEDRSDETWAIFVRNWGNEGFCSSQQHYLDLQGGSFTFRLPWNTEILGNVTLGGATRFQANVAGVTGPIVVPQKPNPSFAPELRGGGLLVTFLLPPPESRAIVNGELHLQWTGPANAAPVQPAPPRSQITAFNRSGAPLAARQQPGAPPAEEQLGSALAQMSPAQRQIYQAKLNRSVSYHTIAPRPGTAADVPQVTQPPRVREVADATKGPADQLRHDALCAAFANNVPGLPAWCRALGPPVRRSP